MGRIQILSPGFLMTLKDSGRRDYGIFGVPLSGPADFESALLGNLLVGNPRGAAVIEITLGGGRILFLDDFAVAVTGQPLGVRIDERPVAMNETLRVRGGEVLELPPLEKGVKAYLSIGGTLRRSRILGSHSVSLTGGLGRPLSPGEFLSFEADTGVRRRRLPQALCRNDSDAGVFRVIRGPESFAEEVYRTFLSQDFRVSKNSNDMGLRLEGKALPLDQREMISSGVAYGTIQIPPGGQPLVMMADHPVTGGYPRIAGVITRDLSRLSQLGPGDRLSFEEVTIGEAHRELEALEDAIEAWLGRPVRRFRVKVGERAFEVAVEEI